MVFYREQGRNFQNSTLMNLRYLNTSLDKVKFTGIIITIYFINISNMIGIGGREQINI